MSLVSFASLDGKSIAVGFDVAGRSVLLKGVGEVYRDPTLGSCLRIGIHDDTCDFDVILRESEWSGDVLSGAAAGCDYRISLASECIRSA